MVDVNGRDKLQILGKVSETIPQPHVRGRADTRGVDRVLPRPTTRRGRACRELANPIRCPETFSHPDQRLELMDEQGVHGCVMFPTTAGLHRGAHEG